MAGVSLQLHDTSGKQCRSIERAQAMLERWQLALSQRAESLHAALAEFKQHLKQLREDLYTECCSYEGCTSQEVSDMINEQCGHILQSIQSKSESLVNQANDGCKIQYEKWSKLVNELTSFTKQCTAIVSAHGIKCAQVTSNAKKTFNLMLEKFDSDHHDMEGEFEKLLEHVSAASEQDIEERTAEATQLLTTMKDGFHSAKQQAMAFVVRQLQALKEDCETHGVKLQCLLRVGRPAVHNSVAGKEGNEDGVAVEQQKEDSDVVEGAEQALADCMTVRSQKYIVLKDLFTALLEPAAEPLDENMEDTEQQKPEDSGEATQAHAEDSTQDESGQNADATVKEVQHSKYRGFYVILVLLNAMYLYPGPPNTDSDDFAGPMRSASPS